MEVNASIRSLHLTELPVTTRRLLSDLLNSTKVIPTEGLIRLRRDWCGLAGLANISAELGASIHEYADKTARVLELWSRDRNATIGQLLDNLQKMDRYDVYDDILLDLMVTSCPKNGVVANNQPVKIPPIIIDNTLDDSDLLTYDDRPGYQHHYHAFILHADEDQAFVDKLKDYLASHHIEVCTKDKLLPGHATQYGPVSRLISERCLRIILVYSPEFLDSPANTFFRDYAQAISIESRQNRTLPIMYRACTLPPHLALYHMLRYDSGLYNFWEKLVHSITIHAPTHRVHNAAYNPVSDVAVKAAHSAINITELSTAQNIFTETLDVNRLVIRSRSSSENGLVSPPTPSPEGSITSETSSGNKKKKSGLLKTFYKKVTGKKPKKEIMIAC